MTNIAMSPPDQLRYAAALLEQAKSSTNRDEVECMLTEALGICARAHGHIDQMLSPDIEQIGANVRAMRGRVR